MPDVFSRQLKYCLSLVFSFSMFLWLYCGFDLR